MEKGEGLKCLGFNIKVINIKETFERNMGDEVSQGTV